ncbi:MAG: hypothetical protein J7K22_01480 [Nanoarchaeota archaeon]|nr:hypothetical protein [Nanoarchaeota archaeon]
MIRWVEGIVYRDGRVLICKLKHKNPLITRLQWTFPFAELKDEESPRMAVKNLFKNELNMNIEVGKFLIKFVPSENPNIEQLFYEIKYKGGHPIFSKNFSDFTWVKPTQILKYFTTSISKDIMDYLRFLEKNGKGIIIN